MPPLVVIAPTPTEAPSILWRAWISALLVVLAAIAYAPARHFGAINYDDPANWSEEPHVAAGVTGDSLWWAATSTDMGPWMPLTRVSYLLDRQFLRLDPGLMHVENVALHAAAAVLLFLWLTEATGAMGRSAAAACLFVVHPMHVESVAWVTERRDVLSMALLMGAIWGYVRFTRGGRRRWWRTARRWGSTR